MDDDTLVAVWDQKRATFVPVMAALVICHECGNSAKDDYAAFWWDGTNAMPFLVCSCGEQFFRWEEGSN